jgi:hypothetical protein
MIFMLVHGNDIIVHINGIYKCGSKRFSYYCLSPL